MRGRQGGCGFAQSCLLCGAVVAGAPPLRGVEAKARRRADERTAGAAVASWVDRFGLVCPGLGLGQSHAVDRLAQLQADHSVPLAMGGHGPMVVLCPPHNQAKGRQAVCSLCAIGVWRVGGVKSSATTGAPGERR